MNPWMHGWEFWLWMVPLVVVCWEAIFAAIYMFLWLIFNNPWSR
jgi:hypothetical protein